MSVTAWTQPWSCDTSDHSIGVLLLHGFTGSPNSMIPWGQALAAAGMGVRVPLLPGHGTRWQDMNATTWHDWYACAEAALEELTRDYGTVFVMGLSMGGALTLRLAQEHARTIAGVVLVNAAVHSERPDRFLLPVLQHVVSGFPGISNDIAKPDVDEGAYGKLPLKATASMMQMWKLVKSDIAKVCCPVLLFRSTQDHVVEASNATWIAEHVGSSDVELVELSRSFHVATLDYDADVITEMSLAFVRRIAR